MAATQGDEEESASFDEKIEQLASISARQMWTALAFIFLAVLVFAIGIGSLSMAVKSADELLAIKPENRVERFYSDVSKVQKEVELQYAEHLDKMDDEAIFSVSKKFELLYELSLESESDYGVFLNTYEKSVYQIASKVRGSGEWYFYYDKTLKKLIFNNQRRVKSMKRYFQEEP